MVWSPGWAVFHPSPSLKEAGGASLKAAGTGAVGIQLRVAKHFPPVTTDGLVVGLGGLPPVTLLEGGRRPFFEGRRYWGRGCFVLWPHHTAVEQQRQGHGDWK